MENYVLIEKIEALLREAGLDYEVIANGSEQTLNIKIEGWKK